MVIIGNLEISLVNCCVTGGEMNPYEPRQREFPLFLSFRVREYANNRQVSKWTNFQTLYLSSEAATSLSAAGQSPCRAPSSAAAVHSAAQQGGAACIPALSSAWRVLRTNRRIKRVIMLSNGSAALKQPHMSRNSTKSLFFCSLISGQRRLG